MKRREVYLRAREHAARSSADFNGEKKNVQRSWQLAEDRKEPGSSKYMETFLPAKSCHTEITKQAGCGCKKVCLGLLCLSEAIYILPVCLNQLM